jgi:hypothetical protein
VVIVDTTVWVDYLRGTSTSQVDWLDRELTRQRLGLTDLILCEVLQGIPSDQQPARVLRDLRQFENFDTCGAELAVASLGIIATADPQPDRPQDHRLSSSPPSASSTATPCSTTIATSIRSKKLWPCASSIRKFLAVR